MNMKRFYITGVSGTGKSTTGEALQKRGFHVIDIDDHVYNLCKWVHKNTGEIAQTHSSTDNQFFKNHKRICDREKLIELMNDKQIVFVVGLTDNQSEILDLFDKIFLLSCDENTLIHRIVNRTNNFFGKHESEQKMILMGYKKYEKEMLDLGAISITTNKPLNEIVEEIIINIKS